MLLSASLLVHRIVVVSLLPLPFKPISNLSGKFIRISVEKLLPHLSRVHILEVVPTISAISTCAVGWWSPWEVITDGRTKARTDEWGHPDFRG